jgi:hypothetical protein
MHKQLEITLFDLQKKPKKFKTVPFTFEVDDYLYERFGLVDGEIVININDVKKDFPKLLIDDKGNPFDEKKHKIDLLKQDYDLILSVYSFFFQYKKNAYLRQLQYNNEILALEIEQAKKLIQAMPELFSELVKAANSRGIS